MLLFTLYEILILYGILVRKNMWNSERVCLHFVVLFTSEWNGRVKELGAAQFFPV